MADSSAAPDDPSAVVPSFAAAAAPSAALGASGSCLRLRRSEATQDGPKKS
jgi:hypothetical protein